jgi:hypothetical protein
MRLNNHLDFPMVDIGFEHWALASKATVLGPPVLSQQ